MPVITSAVVAVTATALSMGAVATGIATVATVATIGAVVGGIGLAVSVVGAVTKNKDLIKVGAIMGALGAGAGIGAAASSALGLGVSSATSGAGAAGEAAKGAAVSSTAETGKAGTSAAIQSNTVPVTSSVMNQSVGSSVTGGLQKTSTMIPDAITGGGGSEALNGANAARQIGLQISGDPGVGAPVAPAPPPAPAAGTTPPTIDMAGATQESLGRGIVYGTQTSNTSATDPGVWKSIDPSTKMMLGMTGGQAVTGLIGSVVGNSMQRKVAEQNLAFQQQEADRDQAQRDLINRNNAYAPKITYGRRSGLIGGA